MTTPDDIRDGSGLLSLVMVPLADAPFRGAYRWAIYRADGEKPALLWGKVPERDPDACERAPRGSAAYLAEAKAGADVWPCMVYYPRPEGRGRDLPAYHFALPFGPHSWGRTGEAEGFAKVLAKELRRPVRLSLLCGWHPDTVEAQPIG